MQFIFARQLIRQSSRVPGRFLHKTMQPLVASENFINEQPMKLRKVDAGVLRVKKLSEHATLPVRGSSGAAGYDLAR